MMTNLKCFKAYDIRGKVPEDLDEEIAYAIGRAYIEEFNPTEVVVGYDVRLESPVLADAVSQGVLDGGANVVDIGLCGTEEVYFQTFHRQAGGGIMITASHNPKGYNGMKIVRDGARPVSGDSGLISIHNRVKHHLAIGKSDSFICGRKISDHSKEAYIQHLLTYADCSDLKPLRVVANAGNSSAGMVLHLLEEHLPCEFIHIDDVPDGNFPYGVPNPLLPENRARTAEAVIRHKADLGLAWDGDFDRCFFFDASGRFIEGYYLVGLLAGVMLTKNSGANVIHDPRLTWNTIAQVNEFGGKAIQSKTGHAFIKERMRQEDAIYGGEMSAHHYFRDFAYCDSGMIPWLLIVELMSRTGKSLAELVDERILAYPCSGEINYEVEDKRHVIDKVKHYFQQQAIVIDDTDGLSMEFENWRFNLRVSNTEPLLRLNVETRGDEAMVQQKVSELEALI